MGAKTSIAWTQSTWNPFQGTVPNKWYCRRISDGCQNCYAATFNWRWGGEDYGPESMPDADVLDRLSLPAKMLTQPLRWRQPRMVFVNSMTDLFGEWVLDEWIDRVFAVMALTRRHTFQLLTKRAKRMRDYMNGPRLFARWVEAASDIHADWQSFARLPIREPGLPNVWAGVSIESQAYAWRLNYLAETPAAVRWVSAEPLLGPLTLRGQAALPDWVVVGGESGPGYRPMDLDWARALRDECAETGTSFFFKQSSAACSGQGRFLDGRLYEDYPRMAALGKSA